MAVVISILGGDDEDIGQFARGEKLLRVCKRADGPGWGEFLDGCAACGYWIDCGGDLVTVSKRCCDAGLDTSACAATENGDLQGFHGKGVWDDATR